MNSVLLLLAMLQLLLLSGTTNAQEQYFPELTGRVVDQAGLLDEATIAALDTQLAAHENETSNQLVVVTLTSLNGYEIADFANQLGRHWQIGSSEKDNGILLVVASNDHKVRIEVGYGLEGGLTDSLASIIVQRDVLPEFRQNKYADGIQNGVNSILKAIAGEYTAASDTGGRKRSDPVSEKIGSILPLIFIAMVGIPELLRRSGRRKAARSAFPAGFGGLFTTLASGGNLWIGLAVAIVVFLFIYFKASSGGGSARTRRGDHVDDGRLGGNRGGMGGGGFSGGGGSFGGGGASGSW